MSLAAIENELERLSADELRDLAMKAWSAYARKAGLPDVCDEDDPLLLAAIDEALSDTEDRPGEGYSGEQLRARLHEWINSK